MQHRLLVVCLNHSTSFDDFCRLGQNVKKNSLHDRQLNRNEPNTMLNQNQRPPPGYGTNEESLKEKEAIATDSSTSPVLDAVTGNDPPMEDAHPGLQPALVFASYPLAVIVLVSIAAIYFFFFSGSDGKEYENSPAQTETSQP